MRDQAQWAEHAVFMNTLAAEGFVILGGPLGAGEEVVARRRFGQRERGAETRGRSVDRIGLARDQERRAVDDPARYSIQMTQQGRRDFRNREPTLGVVPMRKEVAMRVRERTFVVILMALAIVSTSVGVVRAFEVGEPAPDFRLPSTFGSDISLSDYRGKKWVLVEFYGADFAPT
jgi:AhpC/TSA family protein